MIEAVVFDLGGVLIDWNPRHLYRQLFADEDAMERFLSEVCTMAWNDEQDRGRPLAEATADLARRYPEQAELIAAYYERWPEMLGGPIDGSVRILEELLACGRRVYGLTNFSAETFPVAVERYEFLGRIGGVVVSGRERIAKPDPEFFGLLESRFGLRPETTFYVDDNPRHVAAARALGYDAVVFTDAGALRAELVARGLLPGGDQEA